MPQPRPLIRARGGFPRALDRQPCPGEVRAASGSFRCPQSASADRRKPPAFRRGYLNCDKTSAIPPWLQVFDAAPFPSLPRRVPDWLAKPLQETAPPAGSYPASKAVRPPPWGGNCKPIVNRAFLVLSRSNDVPNDRFESRVDVHPFQDDRWMRRWENAEHLVGETLA
jgi:hypothetical protein